MEPAGRKLEMVRDGLDKVVEVARFYRVSVAQVYAMMQRGTLPFVKLGRSRRIPHRAVLELAARNLVGVEQPAPG
jgi:excisionase family DNA binding protein